MNQRNKLTPEELHARLIVTIGIILAIVFAGSVFALLYALLFITQPLGIVAATLERIAPSDNPTALAN